MRICLYTATALPKLGGQEAVVDALAMEFQKAGHAVWVLAPWPRRSLKLDDVPRPYPVLRHPRFFSTRFGVPWYRHYLARAYRRFGFDVIHCHDTYPTGYLAALLKRSLNIPLVITSHGGDIRPGNARLAKRGLRKRFSLAVETADALICIGAFTRSAFAQLGAPVDRFVDIPNGVHLSAVRAVVSRPSDIPEMVQPNNYALFLGRLAERKGVERLLDAMAMDGTSPVRLVIAGSGPLRAAIDARISRLGLADRVYYAGRVEGAVKMWLLQNARLTVMPSRDWEAFPLVLLESFAAGTPVLGTDIPGLAEWIAPGVTGWVAAGDSIESLASILNQAWSEATNSAMRVACAKAADACDWLVVARQHSELYARLIEQSA